ncbi:centrosomal protein of 152 kDa-like, partial [Mercenaria mercenaria]|uniref:centrosomal protein of 152 kDa-like n=1 Tax=Mercenaria mercenaria TaxID=6596 RepID=UPI00234E5261
PDDSTKCFDCGLTVKNWKSDDEPWKVHARLSKNCSFLRLKYGAAEVDEEWNSAQNTEKVRERNDYITRLVKDNEKLVRENQECTQKNTEKVGALNDFITRLVKDKEKLVRENQECTQKNTEKVRELNDYITRLVKDNEKLVRENQECTQKNTEKVRELNDYITRLVKDNEKLVRENQECTQKLQSGEIIRQLNDYAKELEERIESLKKADQEHNKYVQKLTKRFEFERYFWKRALRAKVRECAMVNDLHRRAVAEKEQLQVERNNIAMILNRQLEEFQTNFDFLNRKVTHLEEQLNVNTVAQVVCMEFGYSREMVMEAFAEWERRHGCKAADLMEILMEVSGEWQASDVGQMVNEERQYRREDRQEDRLEGAVGGQDPSGLSMNLLKADDVTEHSTTGFVEGEDDGIVTPTGSAYREHSV